MRGKFAVRDFSVYGGCAVGFVLRPQFVCDFAEYFFVILCVAKCEIVHIQWDKKKTNGRSRIIMWCSALQCSVCQWDESGKSSATM